MNIFSTDFNIIEFARDNFRRAYTFLLYLLVIVYTLLGLSIGYNLGRGFGAIITAIIFGGVGYFVGLILTILCGGLISTFLSIDENIMKLVEIKTHEAVTVPGNITDLNDV